MNCPNCGSDQLELIPDELEPLKSGCIFSMFGLLGHLIYKKQKHKALYKCKNCGHEFFHKE